MQPRLVKLTIGAGCLLAFFANSSQAAVVYNFTNFDGPGSGMNAATGTNMNGIANTGAAVGFGIDNAGAFTNFIRNPNGTITTLNINGSTTAMAFGINSLDDVVGTDGNGNAFLLPPGGPVQTLTTPGNPSTAFGINDAGAIVGQYTLAAAVPGFFLGGGNFVRIDAPSGPDTVNAQSINNNGLIVGFYLGTDGQVHGFDAQIQNAHNGQITGTAIADPIIPPVTGEPGATFVFSQILGVNDSGIAVGYYGDSTTSQHGYLLNLSTGQYTFLDDPAEGFNNGVEVTQITGINNSGEITGFYTDANGVFHGFVATPAPEPAAFGLVGLGFIGVGLLLRRKR